jgi:hypothetical protein
LNTQNRNEIKLIVELDSLIEREAIEMTITIIERKVLKENDDEFSIFNIVAYRNKIVKINK